jgi:hypothetical protein
VQERFSELYGETPIDMPWYKGNTDLGSPVYPNGVHTIRVTTESDDGYLTIVESSVTVNNP